MGSVPSAEALGYSHSSASPTFAAKRRFVLLPWPIPGIGQAIRSRPVGAFVFISPAFELLNASFFIGGKVLQTLPKPFLAMSAGFSVTAAGFCLAQKPYFFALSTNAIASLINNSALPTDAVTPLTYETLSANFRRNHVGYQK